MSREKQYYGKVREVERMETELFTKRRVLLYDSIFGNWFVRLIAKIKLYFLKQ